MPAANELIAHGRTVEEIRDEIGADWLVYQDLEDLFECSREVTPMSMASNPLYSTGAIKRVISTTTI